MPRIASALSILRATLALGVVASFVGSVACSSAPGSEAVGNSDQAIGIDPIKVFNCPNGYARVSPSLVCQPLISTEASPPNLVNPPDNGCYLSGPIAVPPELAGKGCSLGTWYNGDLNRLWACPAGTPAPPTIAGMDDPYGSLVTVLYDFDSACLGSPLAGWEFIEQDGVVINGACPTGCPIKRVPPPGGGGIE
jgi:hypothetical protein